MRARTAIIVADGLVAAVLTHIVIALVLILADLFTGRGFLYTPILVGEVLLEGSRQGCQVTPRATIFLAYTSIHLITLTLFGILASALMAGSEQRPILWYGALFMFIFVAWHLTGAVLSILGQVHQCVSLWPPTLAGFAGALVMAVYLWRSRPGLRGALRGERYA